MNNQSEVPSTWKAIPPPSVDYPGPSTGGRMYVIKRDGRHEPVLFDKITARIETLCDMEPKLNPDIVDPVLIAQKVVSGVFPGVKTSQLDELAAQTAAYLSSVNPEYGDLAARIAISNLQKQTPKKFSECIQMEFNYYHPKTGVASPLISKEVYDIVMANRERLDSAIKNERDYNYDYFGFKTMMRGYLFALNGVTVERPQYMLMRVSIGIHGSDLDSALRSYDLMSQKCFTHATPTMFNAGTPVPQMSSCFLLTMTEDSIDGIYDTLKRCALISKSAGGIGVSVHNIRASNSYIRGTNGTSNGLVPMLKVYNDTARYVDQGGGKRKGAFSIYLEPWHADIFEFLDLKKNTGKEENRARDLFYALWIPDLFMQRVENNQDWTLFCPNEAPGLADCWGEEFEKLYAQYENTPGLGRRTVNARDLWFEILTSQIETGTPYMLYKDSCNRKSNHQHLGTIKSSNLCVSGDTRIFTDKGYLEIGECAGETVNIWNGFEYSKVVVKQTGRDQKLVRVQFSNGAHLDCTPYHKFYIAKKYKSSSIDDKTALSLEKYTDIIEAKDLEIGMKIAKHELPVIREGNSDFKHPYTHGFFCGDGTYSTIGDPHRCNYQATVGEYCKRHHSYYEGEPLRESDGICQAIVGDKVPKIALYGKKKELVNQIQSLYTYENGETLVCQLPKTIAPKFTVPINYDLETRLRWLEGYSDADGAIATNGSDSLQIGSINREFLNEVRMMLTTMGIDSKVTLAQLAKKRKMPDGHGGNKTYLCQDLYRLLVPGSELVKLVDLGFNPKRLVIQKNSTPNRSAKQFTKITGVEEIDGLHDTFCFTEPKLHTGIFNGILTGQCCEIVEYTSPDEVAVCNLASVSLPACVINGEFDHNKLYDITYVVAGNLNKIIDRNYYVIPQAKNSNLRHRPVAVGEQGLADVFIKLKLKFTEERARKLNREIAETIYFAALNASCDLARRDGPYETYPGSPISQGILQFDMWGATPSPRWDWEGLRAKIRQYGVRNSLLTAMMPTASTAQILGNNECFEPYTSNMYTRRVLAGDFVVVNRELVEDLRKLGLWNSDIVNSIIAANGSVQHIDEIPESLKRIYKTVWEISQKPLLEMAAERGQYIDQSQSFNVFIAEPTFQKLTSMHFCAWKLGLKTGMYYLRTRPAADAIKFTVDQLKLTSSLVTLENPDYEGSDEDDEVPNAVSDSSFCTRENGCLSCGA